MLPISKTLSKKPEVLDSKHSVMVDSKHSVGVVESAESKGLDSKLKAKSLNLESRFLVDSESL